MKRHSPPRLLVCIFFAVCAGRLAAAEPHFPADRPIDIEHIRLDLWVEVEPEFVRANADIVATARRDLNSVGLDAVDFHEVTVEVVYADLDGEKPAFEYDGKTLTIPFKKTLKRGDRVEFRISYTLQSPEQGLHFFGPTDEDPNAPYQVWSQGESTSNRYWVPCLDHPNEMQTTEINCTVDRPFIAISNGKLLKVVDNDDDTRTYHWKMSQPHVSYLIAVAIGEFASKTVEWNGIPVSYYVRKKFEPWIDNSFADTPQMLDFFSDKIGVPYPWEKYAQVCCYNFGGGMENTTCTFLEEGTLHDDRANLDTSSDSLTSHELAHQWFGDLLTCKEWAHLWLNEGFASYFEAMWDEHKNGADAFALNMLGKSHRALRSGDDKPVVYPEYDSTGQQFDGRAYAKGAWILHMIRRRLGDDMFWKAINAYVTRFKHNCVETDDLQHVLEDVSGRSFARFFYDWTRRPGHPIVKVAYTWQPDDLLAKIVIEQTQRSDAFHFPLKLEFQFADSDPRVVTQDVTDKETTMYIPLPSRPVAFRVDPDQAVLMELTEDKPLYLWNAQLTDANAALRVRAVRQLAEDGSDENITHLATRLLQDPYWGVQAEIAEHLGEGYSETAQHALLNGLSIKNPRALAAVINALGEFDDEKDVAKALAKIVKDGNESYRVEAAAIKAYSRVCPPDDPNAVELFRSCLSRDSYREMIRAAAFKALARHGGESVVDEVISWTANNKPEEVRAAAIRALGEITTADDVSEASVQKVVNIVQSALKEKNRRIARAAIGAAEHMGDAAQPLVDAIKVIADKAKSRLHWPAQRALDRIAPKGKTSKKVESLKQRVEELEKENDDLKDKLDRLKAAKDRKMVTSHAESQPNAEAPSN